MNKLKILFVGGTWNEEYCIPEDYPSGYSGIFNIKEDSIDKSFDALKLNHTYGRSSGLATKIIKELIPYSSYLYFANGGKYSDLESILSRAANFDIVFWWANVDNSLPKVRDVKEYAPHVMLVTSKRNDNNKYNFSELINRALGAKANLCVEFSKQLDGKFNMMVFDPLGNTWYNGNNISDCVYYMIDRLAFLKTINRQGCVQVPGFTEVPNDENFFELIKENAEVFHKLINPAPGVTRFLGNSSFRCQRGFPSFRSDKIIYVSRRNVDKRYIGRDAFVPTYLENDKLYYQGENKPSVDTPIQTRLYEVLPNIHYMMHAHVYIENEPFTKHMIPCGGLEEVNEVIEAIKEHYGGLDKDFYSINLIGHGSIVMGSTVDKIKNVSYIGRVLPEKLN